MAVRSPLVLGRCQALTGTDWTNLWPLQSVRKDVLLWMGSSDGAQCHDNQQYQGYRVRPPRYGDTLLQTERQRLLVLKRQLNEIARRGVLDPQFIIFIIFELPMCCCLGLTNNQTIAERSGLRV